MSTEGQGGGSQLDLRRGERWRPVVDGRSVRTPPTPIFDEPLWAGRGPYGPPAAPPREPLPQDDSPQEGARGTAPQGWGGGAILRAPLLAH